MMLGVMKVDSLAQLMIVYCARKMMMLDMPVMMDMYIWGMTKI